MPVSKRTNEEQAVVAAMTRPPLSRIFRALGNSNYRLFWIGQLVSLVGTWMQQVALSWLVLTITNSPLALGTVTTVQFLPILLFTLFGGVLADRFPKRKILIVTQSIMAFQALSLAIITSLGIEELSLIYALALVLGLANALDTPTRQAFVVEMVGQEDLANAVALNSSEFNLARLIGPAVGGFTIALIGVQGCFFVNAASYIGVIASLFAMRPDRLFDAPERPHGTAVRLIGEGIRYAVSTPRVAVILIIIGSLGTFGFNFSTFLPLFAQYVLNSGPVGLGILTSAMGIGALASALGIAYTGYANQRTLLTGAIGFTVVLFLLALPDLCIAIVPLLILLGMASIGTMATANTRVQLITPHHLRGRVMGIYSLVFMGTTPIGAFVTGYLAEHQGVQVAIAELAGICAFGLVCALVYGRLTRGQTEAGTAR